MNKFLLFLALVVFTFSKLSTTLQKEIDLTKGLQKLDIQIILKEQVDFEKLNVKKMGPEEKGVAVLKYSMEVAERTQKPLIQFIKSLGLSYESFYIQNSIFVHNVSPSEIRILDSHESVSEIQTNRAFKVPLEEPEQEFEGNVQNIEWNLEFSKATKAWSKNITGKGFTVANADTGVQWDHEALKDNYRGNKNGVVEHAYHWFDGVRERVNPRGNNCGYNVTTPCDDNGHGTHTTGTAAGNFKNARKVGVAGEATWIACRNMDGGYGRPITYIRCLQFFLAPHDLEGKNPKPELRPVSIGNSYGCPPSELCEQNSLKQASDALRAAGVVMAVSAGNYGSCSSVRDPPSHYESVFSVGASGVRTHSIASYSSKGPVTVDGSRRIKPDITAPGSSVVSALPGATRNRYRLWQANPNYIRDVDATQKLFEKTAVQQTTTSCSSNGIPNNVYGYGSLDIEKAINQALSEL